MAKEYIEREDARKKLCSMCRWEGTENCGECENPIDDIPAADVVEIVRCGECKYRYDDDFCGGRGWPEQLVPDDGYCNNGAIKDGGV